ncbi:hypothetical protein SODG_005547 [Sodalis praecaptivus]
MSLSTKHPLPVNPRAIAIIGAGGIVTDSHLPAYRKAGFTVFALYDRDKQKAKTWRNSGTSPTAATHWRT